MLRSPRPHPAGTPATLALIPRRGGRPFCVAWRRGSPTARGPDMPHEEAEKLMAATALDKRYCRPEEVAYAALYLASEVSAHTTGMPLHLDSIVMG